MTADGRAVMVVASIGKLLVLGVSSRVGTENSDDMKKKRLVSRLFSLFSKELLRPIDIIQSVNYALGFPERCEKHNSSLGHR